MRTYRYTSLAWLLLSMLLPASAFAQAQLNIDKSVDKTAVAAGEHFTYTIAYSCSSITDPCLGGEITDTLPAGLEYVGSQGSIHTQNLTGSYDNGTRTVSFPFKASVPAGSVGQLTITVRFANGTTPNGTQAVNQANSTVTNGPPMTSNSVTTTASAGKTCVVDKKRVTNPPVIGRPLSYNVGFCMPGGNGQLDLTSGTVIDQLPAGATFLSADAGCSYDAGTNQVTCAFPDGLEAESGSSCTYKKITVQYDTPPFAIGDEVVNTVTGSGTYFGEANPENLGTDEDRTTLQEFVPSPNVGGDKARKFEFLEVDDDPSTQTYYLRPRNTGNVDLDDFTLIDTIPVELDVTTVKVGTYNRSGLSGVLSYERSDNPGTWVQWTTFDGDTNQTLSVAALGLGANYITRLRWEYGTATAGFNAQSRPEIIADILATDRNGAPVLEDGRTITNCFDLTGTYNGQTKSTRKCTSFKVEDEAGRPNPDKQITSSGPYIGGSTVSWKVLVRNAPETRTTGALINPIGADLLPAELTYVPGSWAVCGGNVAGAPAPVFEEIADYDGTGRTLLRWSYTGASALSLDENERVEICFDTVLDDDVVFGDKRNDFFLTTNDGPTLGCLGSEVTDTNDVDGDGDRTEKICRDTKNVTVASVAGLESNKYVLGTLDADYNRFPDVGNTVMGGLSDYRLTVKNPGTVPVKDVLVVDILPFIGDEGVLTGQPRLTEWRPNLVNPVTVSDPNITVFYSQSKNPCRPEIKASAGCVNDWSTTPPQDITSVQSLKFDFGNIVLAPQDSLTLEWPMRAPFGSPSNGEAAWNSFAYVSARDDNDVKLPAAEPIKVGIKVFAPSPALVGNFIWYDFDQDGIQDPDEPGFNGVLAELWRDDNGNGIFDPVSPTNPNGDVMTFFTRSGDDQDGNPGFYLFPNVDPADYFIRFETPNGYTITQRNVGGDDLVDSDGDPNTGLTELFNVPPNGVDYSWDLGLYNPNNAALGNFVWYDSDLDGVQDPGEAGVENVLVTLYDAGGNAVDTTRTNAAGFYSFVDLVPGTYSVGFSELPAGFVFTGANAGNDDTVDSDADVFTGRTQEVTLAALDFNRTLDAGIVPPATVGDFVWLDLDEDGRQDQGEPGVEGVTVKLTDANGNVLQTTTTDSDGKYEFLVPSADYMIVFEPPLGYDFTRKDRGNNDTIDSDADPTTGKTDTFFVANGSQNPQYDAGLIANVGLVLQKTVYDGHDAGASCGGGEVASGPKDDPITFCFEVINVGKTFLDDVRVDDPTLGIDRSAMSIARGVEPIAPGDTLVLYYETLIDGRYRNTATATANPTDAHGNDLPAFGDVSDDDTARVRQTGGSSGGGNGGVESDGGMALLLNQRLFERRTDAFTNEALRAAPAPVVMNAEVSAAMLPTPAGAFAKGSGSAGFDLARIAPESGPQSSQAYAVTPRDLLGVTNATSVFAADYVRPDGVRLGALFGTTSALEIYDHTKQTCDRLGGGALESVTTTQIGGGTFVMSELVHATGEVDFAITFVAYRSGSTFTIDSRFVPDAYDVPAGTDEVLNVQIWAMNPQHTEVLAADALAKLAAQGTVVFTDEAEAARIPPVFVRSGRYDGGRLLLDVVNTRRSEQATRLSGSMAPTEVAAQEGDRSAFETTLNIPVLTGEQTFTTLAVETGTLYDISFTLEDATSPAGDAADRYDRAYAADGTWGTNVGTGQIDAFDVIADEDAKQRTDRSYPIARAAYMTGRTSDWASLFRSLRPSWRPVDLDGFDALEMTLSGQGTVQVVVEKASLEGGQHFATEVALTATPTRHRFGLGDFVNASGQSGLTLDDVTAVVFYASSQGGSKPFAVVAQDLEFTASQSVANENAGAEMPTDVELTGNYPNPFAATTTIGYGLPESGEVRLAVYDLLGRQVALLVDGTVPAGRHEATLDATGLASGTYLYRLQTGDRVEVKTMTLVR